MRPSATLTTIVLSLLSFIEPTCAQTPDGTIVPFSTLPTCAALCGPLFDVQGKCGATAATVDDSCFCSDARLTPFNNDGTAGVSSVCGQASCSATADLQAIKTWYTNFCKANSGNTAATTTSSGASTTATSSSSGSSNGSSSSGHKNSTWIDSHYKWIIMLAVLVVVIVGAWVLACLFRRSYIRRKEREIEMLPPVALGPHQLQAMTGGYRYGDGVVDSNGALASGGGHHKEMSSVEATPSNSDTQLPKGKGLRKDRDR